MMCFPKVTNAGHDGSRKGGLRVGLFDHNRSFRIDPGALRPRGFLFSCPAGACLDCD